MKPDSFKSYITGTLLTIALCAIYCLFGGLLQMVTGLFISALLGDTYFRRHYGYGILNSLLVLTVFALFAGVIAAISAGVPLILLGLALALGTRFKLDVYRLLPLCAFVHIANLLVGFLVADRLSGGEVTYSAMMLDLGQTLQETLASQYTQPELKAAIDDVISRAVDMSIMLSPAMFIVLSTVLSYFLLVVYKKMQQKKGTDMSFLSPFDTLKADKTSAVLFVILFILLTAAPAGMFASAAANVLLVLGFLFMVIGMSVFDMQMKRRGTPKTSRRISLFLLIALSSMFFFIPVIALVIWGLLDSFFDFRKLRKDDEEEQE